MNRWKVERRQLTTAEAAGLRQHEYPYVRQYRKIGRNEPCHCNSGKKYKRCHGEMK